MNFSTIEAAGAEAVARAARAAAEEFVLLLQPGVQPLPGAFAVLAGGLPSELGVLGGAMLADVRSFGWMLAPATVSPLPFEPVPITAPFDDAAIDALVHGEIDVVAPEMVLAARSLLIEPLPDDALAAMIELCVRARERGLRVECNPAFAASIPLPQGDDRGRMTALRALSERRPELRGAHRLPARLRRLVIDRETRLTGGRRVRVRLPMPPLTVLVHGAGASLAARRARELGPRVAARAVEDPCAALAHELRVRGDRYVLVASAGHVPDAGALADLAERVEAAPWISLAAPDGATLAGDCVLIALGRIPQHLGGEGATLAEMLASLDMTAREAGSAQPMPRRVSIVVAAASMPEILRITLTAAVEATRAGDDVRVACAANAVTTRRIVAAYPQAQIIEDAADPLLAHAVNRALGAATGELIAFIADDVLLPAGTLDRLRAAFDRIPALGAAFPAIPGAPGGEGVLDVQYADLAALRALADDRGVARARDAEPIEIAVSPVFVVRREALAAVGGIDPAFGPTRRGIADLVLRLRAAGYAVVRCDDALAHRFDASLSHNPAAVVDLQQTVPAPDAAAVARGFDLARRVPFERAAAPLATAVRCIIAVPIAQEHELDAAGPLLTETLRAFDAAGPIALHLLLDGDLVASVAAARVRTIVSEFGRAIDETLTVRIERVRDLASWRAALDPNIALVVAAGHDRPAFAGARTVDARNVARLMQPVAP